MTRSPKEGIMPTVTEAQIRRHFEALERGDPVAVSELLADDFVQEWPQSGERIRGAQACMAVAQSYPGGTPRIDVRRVTGEGDHWALEGVVRYPDGSDFHIATLLELQGGRITHQTDYFAAPFPAPDWRAHLVERYEAAPA
jgi:ketosteroid isomerase-like protein